MTGLQRCAVDVDAEPSMEAGFHVHCSVEDQGPEQRWENWFQFIRWEHALEHLAQGRFPSMRGFNNRAQDTFIYGIYGERSRPWLNTRPDMDVVGEVYQDYLDCGDRHCAINTRTNRLRTFEFRLWNSTRSAWRMHLFAGMSRAFVLEPFIERIKQEDVTFRPVEDVAVLRTHIEAVMPRSSLPSLIDRQMSAQPTSQPFTDVMGDVGANTPGAHADALREQPRHQYVDATNLTAALSEDRLRRGIAQADYQAVVNDDFELLA